MEGGNPRRNVPWLLKQRGGKPVSAVGQMLQKSISGNICLFMLQNILLCSAGSSNSCIEKAGSEMRSPWIQIPRPSVSNCINLDMLL